MARLLRRGAEQYGFRGDLWTRARVGEVIEEHFGPSYTEQHVGRILAKIGWTRQKPQKRAAERDEEAIEAWRSERWQELKKSREGEKDHSFR